jgi:hypothetical protein
MSDGKSTRKPRKQANPGDRFGRLVVVGPAESSDNRRRVICRCDCGTVKPFRVDSLYLNAQSCGCLTNQRASDAIKIGQRFGRLVVLSRLNGDHGARFMCQCDCGTKKPAKGHVLLRGLIVSCGCFRTEFLASGKSRTHGKSKTLTYRTWAKMRERCVDPKCPAYPRYGGAGIQLDPSWLKFENFLADMGERPTPKHSIDRYPDQKGNYCKSNCRWATAKEQANNCRTNVRLEWNGVTKTVAEWSEELGMSYDAIQQRIHILGWSAGRALTTPVRQLNRKPKRPVPPPVPPTQNSTSETPLTPALPTVPDHRDHQKPTQLGLFK